MANNTTFINGIEYKFTTTGDNKIRAVLVEQEKALNKVADTSQKTTTRIRDSFAMWGLAIQGVQTAFRQVANAASKLIKPAMEAEAAQKSLVAALRNTGIYSEELAAKIYASSTALQKLTIYEDDAITAGTALMQNIGKLSAEQLPAAQKAAIGLAAAYEMDLNTAFQLVGKAAAGNTATLSRYGIVLDEGLTAQEKFAKVLELGAEKFGVAQEQTETAAGAIAQMNNALGDAAENIAMALLPVIKEVTAVVKDFAELIGQRTPNAYERATDAAMTQRVEFERLVNTYTRLREKTSLSNEEHKIYSQTISDLQTKYANYWTKSLDFEKGAWSDIAYEIGSARDKLQQYLALKVQQSVLAEVETKLAEVAKAWTVAELAMDSTRAKLASGDITKKQADEALRWQKFIADSSKQLFDDLLNVANRVREKTQGMFGIAPTNENKNRTTKAAGEAAEIVKEKAINPILAGLQRIMGAVQDIWDRHKSDTAAYYEFAKFQDAQYYEWKIKQIEAEAAAMLITNEQKQRYIALQTAALELAKKEWEESQSPEQVAEQVAELTDAQQKQYDMIQGLVDATLSGFSRMITEGMRFSATMKEIWKSWVDFAVQELFKLLAVFAVRSIFTAAAGPGAAALMGLNVATTAATTSGTAGAALPSLATPQSAAIITELRLLRRDIYQAQPTVVQMDFKRGELSYAVDRDRRWRQEL